MYQDNAMEPREVFLELNKRGASFAEVEFSGGNDEGGPDSVTLLDESRTAIAQVENFYPKAIKDHEGNFVYEEGRDYWGRTYKRVKYGWENPKEEAETKFYDGLAKPIYDRWGSFAGDFHVSGTLMWDVKKRTSSISGSETVEEEMDYEEIQW